MRAAPDDHTLLSPAEGDLLVVEGLQLRVRVSSRRRRFALTVEMDAGLTLHVPAGRPREEAEDFVRAHRAWVAEKLAAREHVLPVNPVKRLVEGEPFRYLGRTYRLAIRGAEQSEDEQLQDDLMESRPRLRLVAGRLVMSGPQAKRPDLGRAALVDWYCRAGRAWVQGRLQPWAARMAVEEPDLEVRDLGGRWGSYRPGRSGGGPGRVRLGWPLFQLPMHLVDYVVAHELAHIRIPGHGGDYWRLLGQALPEYDERRAELDELGRRMWMGEVAEP